MSKFAVMVFPDEKSAYEGLHALQELHTEGTLTMYGTQVVQRDAEGVLRMLKRRGHGPIGLGVGALVGGLVGLFGGPISAAFGATLGGAAGGLGDEFRDIVSDEFLERLVQNLSPGKFAVVAEISEEWVAPLDARTAELGGTVVREERESFAEELLEKRISARRTTLAQRRAERERSRAERAAENAGSAAMSRETSLVTEIEDARWQLTSMANRAEKWAAQMEQELTAKVQALEAQAAGAKPWVRSYIEQRIAQIRTDYTERKQKLIRANELALEALRH